MNATLSLHHSGISDEDIQRLTIELKNRINRETELTEAIRTLGDDA